MSEIMNLISLINVLCLPLFWFAFGLFITSSTMHHRNKYVFIHTHICVYVYYVCIIYIHIYIDYLFCVILFDDHYAFHHYIQNDILPNDECT